MFTMITHPSFLESSPSSRSHKKKKSKDKDRDKERERVSLWLIWLWTQFDDQNFLFVGQEEGKLIVVDSQALKQGEGRQVNDKWQSQRLEQDISHIEQLIECLQRATKQYKAGKGAIVVVFGTRSASHQATQSSQGAGTIEEAREHFH